MHANTRIERGRSFDAVADTYEKVRPSYPPEIISTLVRECSLSPAARILEIGAGSGKATELLAAHGFSITCLEPGPSFAQILEQRFVGNNRVAVKLSTFEDFTGPQQYFDAVVAAQAFHWLRPEDRFARCHKLLKTGAALALLWNMSPRSHGEFFEELYSIYDHLAAGLREPSFVDCAAAEVEVSSGEELKNSPFFRDVEVFRIPWTAQYSGEEFLQLLDTYSNHRCLEEATRTALFDAVKSLCARFKNTITKNYVSILYIGKAC